MTLNLTIPQNLHTDFSPRITVIGVGGGGTNAVDNMIAMNLQGVEFVVANTDAQQLMHSAAQRRIQLGPHITQGLGAGAKPEIGRAAAEEASDEVYRHLEGQHMVFITAGMGGGTGTGAAPVIARMAREKNILTVGVVTKPFTFEGVRRARAAEQGIVELQEYVDTLIVIPNQNLFRLANERTGWREAFKMADNVLYMGVRGVTDLMMAPGLVNLDFADIRTVMAEMGKAMMGTGEADGENRAIRAAEAAISNPLLEDTSMSGARGLLINITGGDDMTLFEVDQAANRIREEVDDEANIIFGSAIDENLNGKIRVSVVATGIDAAASEGEDDEERPRLVAVGGGAAEPVEVSEASGANGASLGVVAAPPVGATAFSLPTIGSPSAPPHGVGAPIPAAPIPSAPIPGAPIGLSAVPRLQPAHPMGAPVGRMVPSAPLESGEASGVPESGEMPPAAAPRVVVPGRPVSRTANIDPPAPTQQPRRTLFGIVTGAIRGTLPGAPAPVAPSVARAEPHTERAVRESHPEEPRRANVRPAASEEMNGIDIPTFLRRQSS